MKSAALNEEVSATFEPAIPDIPAVGGDTLKSVPIEKIHDILYKYHHGYIPVQEINHAANEIVKDFTEDKILEMTTYLQQFDKELIPLQTVNTKALTTNQLLYAMSDIRKLLQGGNE